jgi:transcriptional regulator with XRE-family HTH domain
MNSKILGKKIKVARVELDLNQTDLADKIGTNQKSVSRYENGLSFPSLETMAKIAKVLKKPVDYFLQ